MWARILRGLLIYIAALSVNDGVVFAGAFDDGLAAHQRGDYATALQIWRPLAEKGNAEAQYSVGVLYDEGKGATQDTKEALKWYRLAAAQKNAGAQNNLTAMYEKGQGVTQDLQEALKLYRLAADQGHAKAQFNLGVLYDVGKGGRQKL